MALQASLAVRNAYNDAAEVEVGASPIFKVFDGVKPADCDTADAGTELVAVTLPADWLTASVGGTKSLTATASGTITGTGTAAYWRIYQSDGTTCCFQGDVVSPGPATDGQFATATLSFVVGVTLTVDSFDLTAINA